MTTTATHAYNAMTANGTSPLPFDFQALSEAEVGVQRNGTETTSGFTVVLYGDGTGRVTPTSSWGSDSVVIYSKPSYKQSFSFPDFQPLFPSAIEAAVDRVARSQIAQKRVTDQVLLALSGLSASALAALPAPPIPYADSGAGAVTRDIRAAIMERRSVKAFGAVGDGVTNDTIAINAALAACYIDHKALYFPAGTYLYDGDGVLGLGVVCYGDGRAATAIKSRLASPVNGYLFNASDYGAGIRGMRFIPGVTQTTGSYVWLASTETFLDDFYMTGDYNGVKMTGSVARIRHGRFQDAAAGAIRIRVEGGDTSQTIEDVLMGAQSPPNIAAAGIRARNSGALILSNVHVLQQGTGLLIDPTTNTQDSSSGNGSVFTVYANNSFLDNNTRALQIAPTGTAVVERSRFANCWFGSSSSDNVTLNGSSITGIEFDNCHGVLGGGAGLTTGLGVKDLTIIGGTWGGNAQGFYFNNGFTGLTIIGTKIGKGAGVGIGGNTNNGIYMGGTGWDNYTIIGNKFEGNGTPINAPTLDGSGFIFGNPGGNLTRYADDLSLSSGKVLKVNGTQVVSSRQTGTAANATDLATALTLVNDLKAKLVAHGLIA